VPMKQLYWSAICRKNRTEALAEITEVVGRHATILNFQRFSDLSLGLALELEAGQIAGLKAELEQILLLETPDGQMPGLHEGAFLLMLNISFSQGNGELRLEVPAVPG